MSKSRTFLIVSGLAFFGWLGWLFYLAIVVKPTMVVVSRAQAIAATHAVVARVSLDTTNKPLRDVEVVEDLRPKAAPLTGKIHVNNLTTARLAGRSGFGGFQEGEHCLLLLTHLQGNEYELTRQPMAPGEFKSRRQENDAWAWAYPWTDEVRRQFERAMPKG